MKLYIGANSRPEDVKKKFSEHYPFLKIELYKAETLSGASAKKDIPVTRRFTDLMKEDFIDNNNNITVALLEESFAAFGLRVRVFRKSGNVWIGTLLTNNWTLREQNNAGEEITNQEWML